MNYFDNSELLLIHHRHHPRRQYWTRNQIATTFFTLPSTSNSQTLTTPCYSNYTHQTRKLLGNRQYHQNISMPNYTVLLESCTQFFSQTYLEHYYTNIQQYTIDAKQLLPHAVPPQENQQVQIVPEVPPIASNHTSSWTRSTPRCSSCSCLFGFTTEGKSSTIPLSVIGLHSMSS